MKVRNDIKKKFKKKIKKLNYLYDNNFIDYSKKKSVIDSYIGHFSYGSCNKLMFKNIMLDNIDLGKDIFI